ncbi:MAG: heavy metal efflux pump, CzcA family protein [Microvirga sp.]|nr:heavy metal efflux pump, CzcA family protein [Microvirga sp.]
MVHRPPNSGLSSPRSWLKEFDEVARQILGKDLRATGAGYDIVDKSNGLDAIPDLSDVQVIVYTDYPGQAPQVVEDQVTIR